MSFALSISGSDGTSHFLIMELIDGCDVHALLAHVRHMGAALPLAVALQIFLDAAEGLDYAHGVCDPSTGVPLGIVHRDVSPANLLIAKDGVGKSFLISGIAKAKYEGGPETTALELMRGKFGYLPPERLQRLPIDRRTDQFSLGIVLYELLAGAHPFHASESLMGTHQAMLEHEGAIARVTPHRFTGGAHDVLVRRMLAKKERIAFCGHLRRGARRRHQSEFAGRRSTVTYRCGCLSRLARGRRSCRRRPKKRLKSHLFVRSRLKLECRSPLGERIWSWRRFSRRPFSPSLYFGVRAGRE